MASFTSKATGNWNADGQTTWNEVGVPDLGDTVTIQSPHTVTVSSTCFCGDGGTTGDGNSTVLTIASGATLAIADGKRLYVGGGVDNAGNIDEGDGSSIIMTTIKRGLVANLSFAN